MGLSLRKFKTSDNRKQIVTLCFRYFSRTFERSKVPKSAGQGFDRQGTVASKWDKNNDPLRLVLDSTISSVCFYTHPPACLRCYRLPHNSKTGKGIFRFDALFQEFVQPMKPSSPVIPQRSGGMREGKLVQYFIAGLLILYYLIRRVSSNTS